MAIDDVLREIDCIRTRQRLTAGKEESLDAERDALIDRVQQPLRRKSLSPLRSRGHQTVGAREIAEIVDVQP